MECGSRIAGLVLILALGGCGGGSSGGGTGGSANPGQSNGGGVDNSWLTLTPSSASLSHYEGEPVKVTVDARSTKTVTQAFNVGIFESSGAMQAQVELVKKNDYEYAATLTTSPTLKAGSYRPVIEVRLCEDDPQVCAKPISGSPWRLTLALTVRPLVNLTPLPALAPRSWSTLGGDALHSGFVPVTLDPAKFNRRWTWQFPGGGWVGGGPVIADGRVYQVHGSALPVAHDLPREWTLRAVDEATGKEVQAVALGVHEKVHHPALAGNRIVLSASTGGKQTLITVDRRNGAVERTVELPGTHRDADRAIGPTPFGASVYLPAGFYGGMARYAVDSGVQEWSVEWYGNSPDSWMPAVDGAYVYTAQLYGAGITTYDAASGKKAFNIGVAGERTDGPFQVPILSGKGMAFVWEPVYSGPSPLYAYDLNKRTRAWAAGAAYATPVSDGQAVYTLDGMNAVAYDAATGTRLWSVPIAFYPDKASLLVTNNLLFVSNSHTAGIGSGVIAIDLATRQIVWRDLHGGALTMSDRGVLYMGTGLIRAINLY